MDNQNHNNTDYDNHNNFNNINICIATASIRYLCSNVILIVQLYSKQYYNYLKGSKGVFSFIILILSISVYAYIAN